MAIAAHAFLVYGAVEGRSREEVLKQKAAEDAVQELI
jgi:hypothetical protein